MEKAIDKMVDLMCDADDWLDEKVEKHAAKFLWFVAFQIVVCVFRLAVGV